MRSANLVRSARRGFTIIELLVVIAIITVLVGLTAAAVFRVQASQAIKRTETVLMKIHSALDSQWKASIDNALTNAPPEKVSLEMALNDSRRAKALWVKICLKREFPERFQEVRDTWTSYPVYVGTTGKQEYIIAVGNNGGTTPNYYVNNPNYPAFTNPTADLESAALLYMVLSTARRGQDFVSDETLVASTRTIQIGSVGGGPPSSYKVFVDSWGTPIKYIRWPDPNLHTAVGLEMNDPQYSPDRMKSAGASQWRDREDPEGLLLKKLQLSPTDANYNPNNNWDGTQGTTPSTRIAVEKLLFGVADPTKTVDQSPPRYDFVNANLMPTAISAGPDKQFGFKGTGTYPYDTSDDIFSFRMRRERQRGE
jgi:prepilin-type N-terminal cleavage/methylation domain-containing protein